MNILFTNARSFYAHHQVAVLILSIFVSLSLTGLLFVTIPVDEARPITAYLLAVPALLGYRLSDYMRGRNNG